MYFPSVRYSPDDNPIPQLQWFNICLVVDIFGLHVIHIWRMYWVIFKIGMIHLSQTGLTDLPVRFCLLQSFLASAQQKLFSTQSELAHLAQMHPWRLINQLCTYSWANVSNDHRSLQCRGCLAKNYHFSLTEHPSLESIVYSF